MASTATVLLADGRGISDTELAVFHGWLGNGEALRLARFVRAERRRQFLIGRGMLRQALGGLLGVAPSAIALDERPGKAPLLLTPGGGGVGFSLSHSGPWVACAVSAESALGLDIERLDPARKIDALARQAFTVEQAAWLAARPAAGRVRDFYELWSEVEACIKLGEGASGVYLLSHPEVSVVLCSAQPLSAAPELMVRPPRSQAAILPS